MQNLDFSRILFFDIETVSQKPVYGDLSEGLQYQWSRKAAFFLRKPSEEITEGDLDKSYIDRAAIFAEFGKIVCVSLAYLTTIGDEEVLRVKSISGDDEFQVLSEFKDLLSKYYYDPKIHFLCGHNAKEFDIPYLCRRMLIHGIPLPEIINLSGKKPWETVHLLDTMEMWKFGDRKNFTSLDLLANSFGIDTPKDDIDGSEVGHVYWKEQDLPRIARYCEKDVVTVAQVLRKLCYKPLFNKEQIKIISE